MPRQIRVQYPGAIYHVMSRGDRREDIYLDDVDRQEFLEECERHTPSHYERRYFWWIGKRNPASGILKAIEPIYGLTLRSNNVVDLGTDGTFTAPRGINLEGSSTGPSDRRFNVLLIRKNVIRDFTAASSSTITSGLYGVKIADASDLNVESNVINNAASSQAAYYGRTTAAKFFNNETSAGVLLRGYDGTKYAQELEDAVQDVLLAL